MSDTRMVDEGWRIIPKEWVAYRDVPFQRFCDIDQISFPICGSKPSYVMFYEKHFAEMWWIPVNDVLKIIEEA